MKMGDRLNILALSFFPAYVPSTSGGELGLYGLLNALSEDHNVILLSSSDVVERAPDLYYHNKQFKEYRVPKEEHFHSIWSRFGDAATHADISNVSVAMLGETPTRLHGLYLENYSWADVIMHDAPYTLTYDLFFGLDNKVRFYNSQNVESDFIRSQIPASAEDGLYKYVEDLEGRLLSGAHVVGACSIEDMAAFQPKLSPSTVSCIVYRASDGVQIENRDLVDDQIRVVFGGSRHPPNTDAARFIVECIAPHLPNVHFDLFGNCFPAGEPQANVVSHGYVSDELRHAILTKAHIALNPIIAGSGVNLKVLESAAYGLAIVSTQFGLRGTALQAHRDCLVADRDEIAHVLSRLVQQPSLIQALGNEAKNTIARSHNWHSTARAVEKSLCEAIEKCADQPPRDLILAVNDYDVARSVGGGASRIQYIYSALSSNCKCVVLCFSSDDRLTSELIDGIFYIRIPKSEKHLKEERRINSIFHISANDTTASKYVCSNWLMLGVFSFLSAQATRIVFEHPYMSPLAELTGARFVYSAHNWEFDLKSKLLQYHPEYQEILDVVSYVEDYCATNAELIISVSEDDLVGITRSSIARGSIGGPGTIVIRSGGEDPVERSYFGEIDFDRPYIVFMGSAHPPNIDAGRFIVDVLAPEMPDCDFRIIGSVSECLSPRSQNVILHGKVSREEKSRVLYGASLALNPMTEGSGSNVKMTEYLGHGLRILSTAFGARGFAADIMGLIDIADLGQFRERCGQLLAVARSDEAQRSSAIEYFHQHLSLTYLSKQFGAALSELGGAKRRILAVLTRYTDPPLGGAEVHMLEFLKALSRDGRYHIDVVAPDISSISDTSRFFSSFGEGRQFSVPIGLERVHWARFPLDHRTNTDSRRSLEAAIRNWDSQLLIDEARVRYLAETHPENGLGWGWHDPERWDRKTVRWAGYQASIFTADAKSLTIRGLAPNRAYLQFVSDSNILLERVTVLGDFEITIVIGGTQTVQIVASSVRDVRPDDPRPRAYAIDFVAIDDLVVDLAKDPWTFNDPTDAMNFYYSCRQIREESGANLGASRGPFSGSLNHWVKNNVSKYDLLISHNPVLKHVGDAIAVAARSNVPSILIPHLHLDDDYYHFPDILQATREATVSLVSPSSLCSLFFSNDVHNVRYLPAGADFSEPTDRAKARFDEIYSSDIPFFLILGRKNQTKNYMSVIRAVEVLNYTTRINIVMIGVDEDKIALNQDFVRYIGRQPTEITAAALKSCVGLVTMSRSESFGIVIAEAWLAGRPVVANKNCAAFRDLITDGVDGLLADEEGLVEILASLIDDTDLANRLGLSGKEEARKYTWSSVSEEFVKICGEVLS